MGKMKNQVRLPALTYMEVRKQEEHYDKLFKTFPKDHQEMLLEMVEEFKRTVLPRLNAKRKISKR